MKYHHLAFRISCPPLEEEASSEKSTINGIIRSVFIRIPECDALVEVEVYVNRKKILPDTATGILGFDINERFRIDEPISDKDTIKVVVRNHDSATSYVVAVIIEIEEIILTKEERVIPRKERRKVIMER